MSLLQVQDLTIAYDSSEAPAVAGISFDVDAGEAVGLVGESGAGKSQTALALMGLLPGNAQTSGSITIDGTQIVGAGGKTLQALRARKISMVFQDPATALNPYVRIGDQLKLILKHHNLVERRKVRSRCIELLERVGLPDPERQYRSYPHQLSGGMRQRALIAAALIGEPALLIADEPTTALDVTAQAQILELLKTLRSELNLALLLITHDLGVIFNSCDRLLVMDHGRIIEDGECRAVLARPQQEHTARLVKAVPDFSKHSARTEVKGGRRLLSIDELTVRFADRRRGEHGSVVAVESVSIDVMQGETLAIVGESGSGKTSFARSVAGLLPGQQGSVRLGDGTLAWRTEARDKSVRRDLQMVFQDPVASLNPSMSVQRIIAEPLGVHCAELNPSQVREKVGKMLERVGLHAELAARLPHELSGGQAQRVAIARALIAGPRLLICDEALAALDGTVRGEILELLAAEKIRGDMTMIVITHDLGVVHEIADRVAVMYRGKICEVATREQIFNNPQQEYTRALLAAVPVINLPPTGGD